MRKLVCVAAVLAVACGSKKKSEQLDPEAREEVKTPPPAGSGSGSGSAGSGSGSADGSGLKEVGKVPAVIREVGLQTPESVLYDADSDAYLVANINGDPTATDDNGFISKFSPVDNKLVELKWIDGAKPDVKLDAPKGMAISGGVLWVADITVVRKFDAKTGKPMGEVKVAGATFLNDVAPGKDGGIYVTDSGMAMKDGKLADTGTDAVYSIAKDGKVTTLVKKKELGKPNGVVESNGILSVVTFGSGEIFWVPSTPTSPALVKPPVKLPKGQLDGIIALEGGDFVVSSWEGKTLYRGKDDKWTDMGVTIESPADIGWDSKRKKILVPAFSKNEVWVVDQ